MLKDYYKILGLRRFSSKPDVKKAYRTLALRHHPDRNPGDKNAEENFKEITEAYTNLFDDTKRLEYDRKISAEKKSKNGNFKAFWESAKVVKSQIKIPLTISFEESILGCIKNIHYKFNIKCNKCEGTNKHSFVKARYYTCESCFGKGVLGGVRCSPCGGRGVYRDADCRKCDNTGRISVDRSLSIKVPSGISSGEKLRVKTDESSHDIIVKINVIRSDVFKRSSNNIHSSLQITLKESLLGCVKEVALVRGKYKLNIPPCIKPGSKIRVKGHGSSTPDSESLGHHFVEIDIIFPSTLTTEQRKIIGSF